jgi:hypothetical protein
VIAKPEGEEFKTFEEIITSFQKPNHKLLGGMEKMKKLMIFVLAGMLLVFGASAVFANPQVDNNSGVGGLTGNTNDGSGSTGSVTTGIGDVATGGSTQTVTETKTFDNSDASQDNDSKTVGNVLSNNTKTVTIDKSAQDNSKSLDVNAAGIASENEKNIAGAQAAGQSTATNTNDLSLLSNNTKTETKTYNKQEIDDTKYGSAAANNGDASATNTKTVTIDKSGQNNSKNVALYVVDNQVMWATTGATPSPIPGGAINQTMNKTFSASTSSSFGGFTGIANNATAAGNFNNTTAYTSISVGGDVNPGP